MDLIKDINKIILLFVFFLSIPLNCEERKVIFKYENDTNNTNLFFTFSISDNKGVLIVKKCTDKEQKYYFKNEEIISKINSLFDKFEMFQEHNDIGIINSDVTEIVILQKDNKNINFLFYDNFIPLNSSENSESVIKVIKEILRIIQNKDKDFKLNYPEWLYS